jgi:6-pyruvoyltetrahydropterin/6-carboxytetrahydropterin synthase
MSRSYIRVGGQSLGFSASHFITLGPGQCETLHGHDYGVSVKITGPLGDECFIVDFVAVRQLVERLIAPLDHRLLLPAQHRTMRVSQGEREVEVTFGERRWIVPRVDCVVLPLANITAEELARHLGEQIRDGLLSMGSGPLTAIEVELNEGPGYSAGWQWEGPR